MAFFLGGWGWSWLKHWASSWTLLVSSASTGHLDVGIIQNLDIQRNLGARGECFLNLFRTLVMTECSGVTQSGWSSS